MLPNMILFQNEAAFLLWFHALDGEDMVEELVGSGVINVCLFVMDNEDATPLDKSCAAGSVAPGFLPEISYFKESQIQHDMVLLPAHIPRPDDVFLFSPNQHLSTSKDTAKQVSWCCITFRPSCP